MDYATLTIRQLKAEASAQGIRRYDSMPKAQLIAALQAIQPEEDKSGKFPGIFSAPEPPQAIPTETPPSQSQAVPDEPQSMTWLGFGLDAIRSTIRAYGPELRAIAQELVLLVAIAMATTIYAGKLTGRAWRSNHAGSIRSRTILPPWPPSPTPTPKTLISSIST